MALSEKALLFPGQCSLCERGTSRSSSTEEKQQGWGKASRQAKGKQ